MIFLFLTDEVELGLSGELASVGESFGDSSVITPFFRFSSKATRARQKLFSCSFIVERRGKRFPQYWHAKKFINFRQ